MNTRQNWIDALALVKTLLPRETSPACEVQGASRNLGKVDKRGGLCAFLHHSRGFTPKLVTSAASTTSKVRKMRLGWKTFNLGIAARAFVNQHALRIVQEYGYSQQSSSSLPMSRSPSGLGHPANGSSSISGNMGGGNEGNGAGPNRDTNRGGEGAGRKGD
eukprot:1148501-Pelagomonas_calceolata.AAC.1